MDEWNKALTEMHNQRMMRPIDFALISEYWNNQIAMRNRFMSHFISADDSATGIPDSADRETGTLPDPAMVSLLYGESDSG